MNRALWAPIVAVPVIVVLALGLRHDPNSTASTLVGKPAPAFTLHAADGRTVSLASLHGHPVVLNFWATWCTSCLTEHPNLVAAWRRYASRGVEFLGISFQDSAGKGEEFLRQHGGNWPVLSDPDEQTAISYGVTGPPETVLIDRNGIVRYKAPGAVAAGGAISPANFMAQLDRLVRNQA
jgi:cytochrome c biogenesis protein CcmG/thiol:disulfide interchange protein DsbE